MNNVEYVKTFFLVKLTTKCLLVVCTLDSRVRDKIVGYLLEKNKTFKTNDSNHCESYCADR